MSWFLQVLRCILFCGDDEEWNHLRHPIARRDHYAASNREDARIRRPFLRTDPPPTSPAKPPATLRPPELSPPRIRIPPPPSKRSPSFPPPPNPLSPSKPPPTSLHLPPSSKKASPTPLPSSNVSSAPLPSPKATPSPSLSSRAYSIVSPKPTEHDEEGDNLRHPRSQRDHYVASNRADAGIQRPFLRTDPPPKPPATLRPPELSPARIPIPPPPSKPSPSLPPPPNPLPPSKPPPTSLHLPPSSKKASPTPLPSSNVSLAPLPSPEATPSPSLSSRAYSIASPKPTVYDDDISPELSVGKQRSKLSRYEIPKHLKELIERDKVPRVLKSPLSPSTYADYFATLLYAEDFYVEKWSEFLLTEVTLELRSRAAFENARDTKKVNKSLQRDKKDFVAFEINSVPERRPFLLSRDFVFVRPSGKMSEPFKGILFRVVKSTLILVEFGDDFHAQHLSTRKYDVSFSFNRVCLKRAHQAISAAMDPSFHNILFPGLGSSAGSTHTPPFVTPSPGNTKLGVIRILGHKGPLPYLIEGPLSTTPFDHLSDRLTSTGSLIQEAILQLYRADPHCRILICAPRNRTCDALMRSLRDEIPKSMLFRANAAFRDSSLVPDDIFQASLFEGECFTCPPLAKLRDFKVVTSTFMSSFRLHDAGINADHFTHIFVVDASSAVEPEAVVAIVNLVGKKTSVVVTGSSQNYPGWVRSDIGRRHGLRKSYFQRLLEGEPYMSRDPKFITHLM